MHNKRRNQLDMTMHTISAIVIRKICVSILVCILLEDLCNAKCGTAHTILQLLAPPNSSPVLWLNKHAVDDRAANLQLTAHLFLAH